MIHELGNILSSKYKMADFSRQKGAGTRKEYITSLGTRKLQTDPVKITILGKVEIIIRLGIRS